MLYFALHRADYDGGVMITGSHNPVNDNGLKICRKTSSFLGSDIQAIRAKTLEEIAPFAVDDDEAGVESRSATAFFCRAAAQSLHVAPPHGEIFRREVGRRRIVPAYGYLVRIAAEPFGAVAYEHGVGVGPEAEAEPFGFH